MEKGKSLHLQEIIFSSSNPEISRAISRLLKEGHIRKIAPKIYTPNLEEDPSVIIRRSLFRIIGHLYPGILLSHRSALEFAPTKTGDIFLTYTYERKVKLPGITLNIVKGHPPIAGDNPMSDGLYVAQKERAMIENFQESRKSGEESKTLERRQIEDKLETIVRVQGEDGLNALRDKAREISEVLGMEKEFNKLNAVIGSMLATRNSKILTSPIAIARAFGHPYDPDRLNLFEKLFVELQQRTFADIPDKNTTQELFRNFAFYEAYFSNFIEGTRFEVEDARRIIETQKPLPARDEDSHDVLGTYQIVSNRQEMSITPKDAEELITILLYRHKIMLSARPNKNPGTFKDRNNRAGDTEFVDYNLVRGTLIRGFDFYRGLAHPFAKAAYMMFLVSEVHPFPDGNGRIARVMMNAELVKEGQSKIIIPTVFREDYLGGLRQLTRRSEPDTYIRMLQRAQLFSTSLSGQDLNGMKHVLVQSNAFKEGDEHILRIVGE
ncbi:Fic family protein [Flavobacterium gawalongense]|uniref:Cell filamentation protein Fic n=1 Tax=Flavobacterium gawalongense TaxID=2594432 RepID=A0A553BSP2_9FLAO|nr:Fic family protein [Flavobacterium gawalongense]TRX03729.1 cell filamentation protein Fic [Flavobacterium gawalongense]TRX08876.1 cell filamentation protein Fic [Flavobacterium gawalongense]TRX11259.1 cell filamentation protein Fic [Flavobacterium gawalongense]TRX12280.1 cell filamentation protein Fic [Flavobacterium gawalongense]TRX30181.1 cell filamentation protein Fic [Flavobacterium gawalongense]